MSRTLESFDGTERIPTRILRPETYQQLHDSVVSSDVSIARGAGLSYSAASFGQGAVSIDLSRFDRLLGYDAGTGQVDVEPGVRVGELAAFLHGRGRHLPALPGYPTITVGGCIAFDIHGKSQFHSGNFGDWVEQIELLHRDHGALVCSREQEREVFELTVGGAGWTGIVTRARLRTAPLPGQGVELATIPVGDLREAADVLRTEAGSAASLYSWNDLNRHGKEFGRGVVYRERFVEVAPDARTPEPVCDIWSRFRWRGWNRLSTSPVLGAYAGLQRRASPRVLSLGAAHFPIRGKEYYYAAFGPGGFREYQLIVPFERWPSFVEALKTLLGQARVPVTLGSLKLFQGDPTALRFRMPGICLALDVPAGAGADLLWSRLDELAIASGALVNLSKDSRLSAAVLERLFPNYDRFRTNLLRFDPLRRCGSRLRDQAGV